MAAVVRSGTGAEGWLRSSAANWALWEVVTGGTEWVAGDVDAWSGLQDGFY
jgi:hypothetical protein